MHQVALFYTTVVLLAKSRLNCMEVLIYKTLIDTLISHDKFVLINNVQKWYNDMKEEMKNLLVYL